MKTKEKILQEALRLFSTKDYAATGVEEIAAAVGIKAASLYKHYRNKRAFLMRYLRKQVKDTMILLTVSLFIMMTAVKMN